MNSLLKRQIKKNLKPEILKELKFFLKSVNDSYDNYEDQLKMSQRAMKISSDELFEANKKLRDEAKSLKEINKNLEAILSSMNLDAKKLATEKEFNPAEYLKSQALEIVNINKQREELLASLELQNEALNEYAHVVSHDLKAPLRTIDTLINWVIDDNKEHMREGCLNSLNLVLYNVEKMDLLIKGILDYSSIGNVDTENRIVNFNLIIEDILRTIVVPKHIEIIVADKLPKYYGNSFKFTQIFQNLIQNAIKYNDKDKGIIEIGTILKNGKEHFYVKDNGIGIEKIYHNKIFKVFTKLESDNQSSGIGLSIVKKIIHYYQGELWVESEIGKGSTFYFTLQKK